ncbi:hypothetical protein ZIOFF_024459 [Zingiber officinale]|uniref:CCHC-type domain-containing protein n=1 Tax=Zingiber officinale TaxID=94328 RepID=A0A8J5H8F0_ZINOF|nr:hypothetical protein ZIOFF_024459 [Zingiber officinale]
MSRTAFMGNRFNKYCRLGSRGAPPDVLHLVRNRSTSSFGSLDRRSLKAPQTQSRQRDGYGLWKRYLTSCSSQMRTRSGVRLTVDLTLLTWADFKEVFYGKYFTVDNRTRLAREFLGLRQGDMTVAEYVRRFERGRYFVPMITSQPVEELKHFTQGLRLAIRHDVRLSRVTTFREAVDQALMSERDRNDIVKEAQNKRLSYQGRDQQEPGKKRSVPAEGTGVRAENKVRCSKCEKIHAGQCLTGTDACYMCKKSGHFARECPLLKEPTKGRVFAMTQEQVDLDTAIITGEELHSNRMIKNCQMMMQDHMVVAPREQLKLSALVVKSNLLDQIREGQMVDQQLTEWKRKDEEKGQAIYSTVGGVVRYKDRIWVPKTGIKSPNLRITRYPTVQPFRLLTRRHFLGGATSSAVEAEGDAGFGSRSPPYGGVENLRKVRLGMGTAWFLFEDVLFDWFFHGGVPFCFLDDAFECFSSLVEASDWPFFVDVLYWLFLLRDVFCWKFRLNVLLVRIRFPKFLQ